ncbi:hypothetical protein [Variovorax sp. JS1663]|uniref:hypothetical protein n=1 Tax=Variovorax sp. JS1663 TaxID=1851577 RepID=UPI000B346AEB|nr:hypothetical protein [Variovorax sp. JS1663]OUM01007.1 hypothetical protein A8M77_18035 [Variovorax sp. JS1663]
MRPPYSLRKLTALSLLAVLAGSATMAQAAEVWARVVSVTPSHETTGSTRYNVTYEYGGRHYTMVTDARPGASIPIEVGDYGVATTSPVAPQPPIAAAPVDIPRPDWNNVTPEPGVVVSGGGGAPVYAQPQPVYAQPAPVYYPAPVYVGPAYYPAPYVYPPIGLSLNLGYSRGWRGGWHGRWR